MQCRSNFDATRCGVSGSDLYQASYSFVLPISRFRHATLTFLKGSHGGILNRGEIRACFRLSPTYLTDLALEQLLLTEYGRYEHDDKEGGKL